MYFIKQKSKQKNTQSKQTIAKNFSETKATI